MGGASSYLAMLAIAGFLGATWTASKVSKLLGVSDIVLVITTGVIFGPDIVGLISKEYTVCSQARHTDCDVDFADLQYKVANGLPLGEHLGKIQHMGLCHEEDYHHAEDAHATGTNHSNGTNVTGHSADAEHSSDDHGALEDAHADAHSETTTVHPGEDDVEHGHEDTSVHGAHRRLAGGGGNFASYEECLVKTCNSEISHECQLTPDVFTLIGHAGVALMIFESGMHFDFEKAKIVGAKACLVAVLGTLTPLITGAILTMILGYGFFPQGISAGTALAPTSVGIALRLLGEAGVLQENFGQAIITAAFVDDILSLVLFNILFSLGGEFDFVQVVVNPVVGIVFMLIAMYAAMAFWPKFINGWLLPKVPVKEGAKVQPKDEVLFLLMIVLLLTYATITYFLGTHLWGCFIAGMSFACLAPPHHAHHVWVKQTKRVTSWMIRIFFACTVAFAIPVAKLLSIDAFWKGAIMGAIPCILTKVTCAPFMGDAKWVIGWAMVGRAEFAYLIAQMAAAAGMLSQDMFSVVIWALLWATIFAPFVFRFVLNKYVRDQGLGDREPNPGYGEDEDGYSISEPSERGDLASDQEYKSKMEELKVAPVPVETAPAGQGSEARCCAFSRSVV